VKLAGSAERPHNGMVEAARWELRIRHLVNVRPLWCPAVFTADYRAVRCRPLLRAARYAWRSRARSFLRIPGQPHGFSSGCFFGSRCSHKPKKLILGQSANHGSIELGSGAPSIHAEQS
jgi:hypothetical protein